MGRPLYTAQQFIEAMPGTGGIITAIAKRVGCSWNTAQNYINTHPTVRAAYDNECESVLDLAEVKLIEAVKEGDSSMIRFYLSTKGKNRGYVERQEMVTSNETLEVVTISLLNRAEAAQVDRLLYGEAEDE